MNDRTHPAARVDTDDIGCNNSANPTFQSIFEARLSRRAVLKGGAGLAAASFFGFGLNACDSDSDDDTPASTAPPAPGFNAVAKSVADALTVPPGYTATVFFALGDPIDDSVGA